MTKEYCRFVINFWNGQRWYQHFYYQIFVIKILSTFLSPTFFYYLFYYQHFHLHLQGNHLAVGTNKGLVQIWDTTANKRISVLQGHSTRVGQSPFSPQNRKLYKFILTQGKGMTAESVRKKAKYRWANKKQATFKPSPFQQFLIYFL